MKPLVYLMSSIIVLDGRPAVRLAGEWDARDMPYADVCVIDDEAHKTHPVLRSIPPGAYAYGDRFHISHAYRDGYLDKRECDYAHPLCQIAWAMGRADRAGDGKDAVTEIDVEWEL